MIAKGLTYPFLRCAGLSAGLVATIAGPAQAGTLSASNIFSQFNAVVFGDFSSTSDVEGRTAVGGNLTGGATFDLNPAGAAASSFAALDVYGGATSGGSYNVDNGGGIAVAGTNSGSVNLNGGGSAYVGGNNSGTLNLSGGPAAIAVIGANSGTLSLSSGGNVYVGAGTTGGVNADGSVTVGINGNSSANINLNRGGTISLNGSNSGTVSLNGGSIAYTGNQAGNLNLNGGATAKKVPNLALSAPTSPLGSFATTFQAPLTALSTRLNGMTANSTATSSRGTITFNARPDATGTAVFDIGSSLFTPNSTATFALNNATSVIINVNADGCASSLCAVSLPNSLNFNNPAGYAASVLWNFSNANSLTFTTEFGGSVLAPLASVFNSGPIDGTLVAASYAGNGELHSHPYSGTLVGAPQSNGSGKAVPAPEPGSLGLLISGLAALVTLTRKRPGLVKAARQPGCGSCGSSAASAPG